MLDRNLGYTVDLSALDDVLDDLGPDETLSAVADRWGIDFDESPIAQSLGIGSVLDLVQTHKILIRRGRNTTIKSN